MSGRSEGGTGSCGGTTGMLSGLRPSYADYGPLRQLAAARDGRTIYLGHVVTGGARIVSFGRDPQTGALRAPGQETPVGATSDSPAAATPLPSADGRFLYGVVSGAGSIRVFRTRP